MLGFVFRKFIVTRVVEEARGVVRFRVAPEPKADPGPDVAGGGRWAPGSHIDVSVVDGLVRQYSLLPAPSGVLEFAVKVHGAGSSSAALRQALHVGAPVGIGKPRSTFALEPAGSYRFIAAGIGITPLYSMIHELASSCSGVPWHLVYVVPNASHAAFLEDLDRLAATGNGAVQVWATGSRGRPGPDDLLPDDQDALVYACGPSGLLDQLEGSLAEAGRQDQLRVERFTAGRRSLRPPKSGGGQPTPTVQMLRKGVTVAAREDASLVDALNEAGAGIPTSCRRGICGTCEVPVKSGLIDHADDVLSAEEKASGKSIIPCVSRPASPTLVLDV